MNAESSHYSRTQAFHDQAARERGGFYDWKPEASGAPHHSRWQARTRALVLASMGRLAAQGNIGRVLDVGCGKGDFAREVHARLPQAQVVGVDFSTDMIELARQGLGGSENHEDTKGTKRPPRLPLDFRVASLPALELGYEAFDVVVCLNVFHHVHADDQALALGNMLRRARRAVILEIKNARCPYKRLPRGQWLDPATRVFPTTARAIAGIATANGFRVAARAPIFGIDLLSPIVVLTLVRAEAS